MHLTSLDVDEGSQTWSMDVPVRRNSLFILVPNTTSSFVPMGISKASYLTVQLQCGVPQPRLLDPLLADSVLC